MGERREGGEREGGREGERGGKYRLLGTVFSVPRLEVRSNVVGELTISLSFQLHSKHVVFLFSACGILLAPDATIIRARSSGIEPKKGNFLMQPYHKLACALFPYLAYSNFFFLVTGGGGGGV